MARGKTTVGNLRVAASDVNSGTNSSTGLAGEHTLWGKAATLATRYGAALDSNSRMRILRSASGNPWSWKPM